MVVTKIANTPPALPSTGTGKKDIWHSICRVFLRSTLIPPFTATSITNLNKLENFFFWSHLIFSFCCQIHVFIPNKFKTTEGKNFRCVWTLNCWTFCSSGELTSLTRPLVVLNGSSEPEGRKIPCTPTTAPTVLHQQYYTWVCVYTDTSHTPLCSISFLWAVSSPCWINK